MFEGLDSASLEVLYTIDAPDTFKSSGVSLETLLACLEAASSECRSTAGIERFSVSELAEIQRGLISAQTIVVATWGKNS